MCIYYDESIDLKTLSFDDLYAANLFLNTCNKQLLTVLQTFTLHGFYIKTALAFKREETMLIKSLLYCLGKIVSFDLDIPHNLCSTWPKVVTAKLGDVIFYSVDGNDDHHSLKMCLNDKLCIGLKEGQTTKNHLEGVTYRMLLPSVDYIKEIDHIIKIARP